MAKLGAICELVNGYAFKPTDWSEEGLPIIRIQNLNDNNAPFNYYNGEIDDKYYVKDGDLLFAWSGTPGTSFGAFFWKRGKGILNQHIFNVYPVESINKEYFRYALNGNLDMIISKAHGGVGLKHITKKELENIDIPLPPLETQRQIAANLDKVIHTIDLCNAILEKLDLLVKARFVEMFGDPVANEKSWSTISLDDACDGIGDGLHGTPEYDDNGEYPFINGNNLMDGTIVITSGTKMVDEVTYRKHYIDMSDNAILISINGTLGKIAFYNGEKVMLGKSACYCNLKSTINRIFVYGLMKSDAFAEFLENHSTKSTIKNVGLKAMREYQLIIPPLDLQLQFAAFVEQTDKSKLAVKQVLEKAETLKKALMQEYFG